MKSIECNIWGWRRCKQISHMHLAGLFRSLDGGEWGNVRTVLILLQLQGKVHEEREGCVRRNEWTRESLTRVVPTESRAGGEQVVGSRCSCWKVMCWSQNKVEWWAITKRIISLFCLGEVRWGRNVEYGGDMGERLVKNRVPYSTLHCDWQRPHPVSPLYPALLLSPRLSRDDGSRLETSTVRFLIQMLPDMPRSSNCSPFLYWRDLTRVYCS